MTTTASGEGFDLSQLPDSAAVAKEAFAAEFGNRPEDDKVAALPLDGDLLGNVYRLVQHYTTVPTWWRRFMFRVLDPRDVVVYLYICGYMNANATARPTLIQMQADMNLSNAHSLIKSIRKLDELGFLIRRLKKVPETWLIDRNVFLRPMPEFTLLRLLELRKIDARLNPLDRTKPDIVKKLPVTKRRRPRLFESGVSKGLRNLLGPEAYAVYFATPDDEKRSHLMTLLGDRVRERQLSAGAVLTNP